MKAPKHTVATASFHAPGELRIRSGRARSVVSSRPAPKEREPDRATRVLYR